MSRLTRPGQLPETHTRIRNGKKSDTTFVSSSTLERLDVPKKLLSRSIALSSSPYAIKQVRSVKNLENIKIRTHNTMPKKSIKLFKNQDKSFNMDSKKKLMSSFSFISSDELSRIETKEISMSRAEVLLKKLENVAGNKEKFEACHGVFNEIVDDDKEFIEIGYRTLFKIIKKEYDRVIKYQRKEIENQIQDIKELESIKILLSSELEKLINQNKDLSYKFDELHKKYTEVSDKFLKITNIELTNFEKTDENWIKILQENRMYEEALYNLKKDLTYYKVKTKKMMKLIVVFEQKGYPVEDIYNKEVKKKKSLPRYDGSDSLPDDTDNENIISGKSKDIIRPSKVPELNFSLVEPNSFTSESQSDQLSENSIEEE